jgi:putative nucleotidyltransferase with HDIG domain
MSAAKKIPQEYIVDKLDELPTLPTIIYELSSVINNPMSSTREVEALMSNDMSITTKVLKLANSAYYAIPGGVTSLSRAISYLGFDTVNQLVISSSIIDALKIKNSKAFNIQDFWKHSIGVGITAETIASYIHHPMPTDLFTCGLVHDMGKVAYFTIDPEGSSKIAQFALDNETTYLKAEQELEMPRHTQVGSLLARKWKLPDDLEASIKHHHQKDPRFRADILSDTLQQVVDIVYLSNILIHALKFGNSGHNQVEGLPKDLLERLTIDPKEGYKQLLVKVKNSLSRADEFIRIIGGAQ